MPQFDMAAGRLPRHLPGEKPAEKIPDRPPLRPRLVRHCRRRLRRSGRTAAAVGRIIAGVPGTAKAVLSRAPLFVGPLHRCVSVAVVSDFSMRRYVSLRKYTLRRFIIVCLYNSPRRNLLLWPASGRDKLGVFGPERRRRRDGSHSPAILCDKLVHFTAFSCSADHAPGREANAAPPGYRSNATQVGSSLKETDIERLRQRLHDTINSSAVRYRDIERSTGLPGYQVRNFVNAITKKPSLHLLGTLYTYFRASEPRPTSTSLSPLVSILLRFDERAGPQSIKEFQGAYFCLRRSFQDINKANLSLVRIGKGRNRFARFSHTFYISPNGGRVHRHVFIGAAFLLGNKLPDYPVTHPAMMAR